MGFPQVQQRVPRADTCALGTNNPAILVSGTAVFRVVGGPINLLQLASYAETANDVTASTLQWSADGDLGAATTFTGASASLASQVAGAAVVCNLTALTTAPDIVASGVGLAGVVTRGILIPAGIITMVVGTGPTTGRWRHYLVYAPLGLNVRVEPLI